ncbi:hypothetical protein PROFUN_06934 [Planoprotostelium fungivorum]|uniref:Cullin family profile domain-containing protein n=1 Tax=Planoprotostelium fungivorum TaxID=1890364 RepID=A0A2P6NN20_9EUKA|nr:hypothetical protein PROFUN_06934 [Planoprotostelium fungivorum]
MSAIDLTKVAPPTRISRNVYLGVEKNAIHRDQLIEYNLYHIININGSQHILPRPSVLLVTTGSRHNRLTYTDSCERTNDNVLIVHRRATKFTNALCVGHLMFHHGCSFDDALYLLKRHVSTPEMTDHMIEQLLQVEEEILENAQVRGEDIQTEDDDANETALDDDASSKTKSLLESQKWTDIADLYHSGSLREQELRIIRVHLLDSIRSNLQLIKDEQNGLQRANQIFREYFEDAGSVLRIPGVNQAGLSSIASVIQDRLIESVKRDAAAGKFPENLRWAEVMGRRDEMMIDAMMEGLSIRLLNEGIDDSTRNTFVDTLSKMNRPTWKSRVQNLFRDESASLDLSQLYQCQSEFRGVGGNFRVISSKLWAPGPEGRRCLLPETMEKAWEDFRSFYEKYNPGKRLQLAVHLVRNISITMIIISIFIIDTQVNNININVIVYGNHVVLSFIHTSKGNAVMNYHCGDNTYELVLPPCMTAVLSLYNDADSLDREDIHVTTGLDRELLLETLYSLSTSFPFRGAKMMSLLKRGEDGRFRLNEGFKSKRTRVEVPLRKPQLRSPVNA